MHWSWWMISFLTASRRSSFLAVRPMTVGEAEMPKKAAKKARTVKKPASSAESGTTVPSTKKAASPKTKKAPAHQVLTERDEIPKLWHGSSDSYTFRVASWNVAGLRALLRNHPTALPDFCAKHKIDLLCLQEHKLQEQHLDDPKLKIQQVLEDSYDSYWSCSTAKKGYSGTAVFVKKRKKSKNLKDFFGKKAPDTTDGEALPIDPKLLVPDSVTYKMGFEKHDAEGRLVAVDYPWGSLVNVYVPNSGQKLERLDYRTKEWDKDWIDFMREKQKSRPVLWLGDLNVAHTNLEVWNDGAKHLDTQAGVTPQERASFQEQLDSGFIDAFRKLHPQAKGHYSYWSVRAGNRVPNKGLRLDYFICDPSFFDESSKVVVRDSYIDHEQIGSDHCPVILELEIKK